MQRFFVGLAAMGLLAGSATAQDKAAPPPLDFKAIGLTAELFTAIRHGDKAATIAALDHGADPNRRNWIDMTPVDWAYLLNRSDLAALLIQRGARLDNGTYGSPAVGATMMGREKEALALLDQGAGAVSNRPDKATTLMLAAAFGSPKVIDRLKPDATELAKQDIDGATALIYAARLGQAEATKRLLALGAAVDQADSHGRTPLMYAAMNGHKPVVDVLLAAGAKPSLTDKTQASALHLVARYSGNVGVTQSLLRAKAGLTGKDTTGKTPLTLASARKHLGVASALKAAGARSSAPPPHLAVGPAVEKSLVAFQGGMKRFLAQSECASCHHQGLGVAVLGRARLKGFAVDSGLLASNVKRTEDNMGMALPLMQGALQNPQMSTMVPTAEMGEIAVASAYFFWALEEAQVKPNPVFTTLAQYSASLQLPTGNWQYTLHRGPMQESQLTATAFQILGLRRFVATPDGAERIRKAQAWLQSAPTPTTEDKAARLLGLRWSGQSAAAVQKASPSLVALQNADGGFGAKAGAASDAHTTGMVLYSLRVAAGLPVNHASVKKATDYLLRTQDETGAWYANKTIQPFNYFFDTGFPGGESQYSSFGATGWATLALMEVLDRPKVARR